MQSQGWVEKTIGKKIKFIKNFNWPDGHQYDDTRDSFKLFRQVEEFLESIGMDYGSMERSSPIGLLRDCSISKWRNLDDEDKLQLEGLMLSDSFRSGEIKIMLAYDPTSDKPEMESVETFKKDSDEVVLTRYLNGWVDADTPKYIQDMITAFDSNKQQFCLEVGPHGGWVSPNGVFYPCRREGHNDMMYLLMDVFNISGTQDFEEKFVKVADDYYDQKFKTKIVYYGKPTARQKIWLGEWVKKYKSDVVNALGDYQLFGGDIIDKNYRFVAMK